MSREKLIVNPSEDLPEYKFFEGIRIQWNKVPWYFYISEHGTVSIDSYSIWNPRYHEEIAGRLARGERCALYMVGTYGVAEIREMPEWQKGNRGDVIFDEIKQRDRLQNLVVFADPEDIRDLIDFKRLPFPFRRDLHWPEARYALYPGPMHAILPIIDKNIIDPGLFKQGDKTAAFFWIPGHWGYEELAKTLLRKVKHGLMGGGSLNIHQQEPCFTTSELKEREMSLREEWITNIDFIIMDELSEAEGIGRSHTQISFLTNPPKVVRIGSLSPEKISRDLGYKIPFDLSMIEKKTVKAASSLTPYDELHNIDVDQRVESALAKIARFKKTYKEIQGNF